MYPVRAPDANNTLVGENCADLPVTRVYVHVGDDAYPGYETIWHFTPAEIQSIRAGAPVVLTVIGTSHPPIQIRVGDI